jgi:protein ImuB
MQRRIVSIWFVRLASERVLRHLHLDAPFAITLRENNTERLYCLNDAAEQQGLERGMGLSDARALFPDLQSRSADPVADARCLDMLLRWAKRYCPWVGRDGRDGLVLDITGSAHLRGGEAALIEDMRVRLMRAGLTARIGLADTRGAAWALARFGDGSAGGRAAGGETKARIGPLPVAALRLPGKTCTVLERLGIKTIADLIALPRPTLTRRFGTDVLMRLDQALGAQPEEISPQSDPPHYGVRMTLPEPIGLEADLMAGVARLLERLCDKLKAQEQGARVLELRLRRVDQGAQVLELRLARPMRDAARIGPLFARNIGSVEAGFGIDQMRLEAVQVESLPMQQITRTSGASSDGLDDLITRLGNRIGLDNIIRFLPADSHIPERSFIVSPAAYSDPAPSWPVTKDRPIRLFPPEPIAAHGPKPPARFRWRGMFFSSQRVTGPERLAPEWWFDDPNWRSGLRDYWRVETAQGQRLWLFHTPQNPGWFVQGEFA